MPEEESTSRSLSGQELQRWWQEHSELDRLVETLVEKLSKGSIAGAQAVLEDLSERMDAHLKLEEDLYFPLVEQFSHSHTSTLRKLCLEHLDLRADLETIRSHLCQGDLGAASGALALLVARLRAHEEVETGLIDDLGQALPG
jgi:iron-sulfur cluster repair protein YtfE (RIC family)